MNITLISYWDNGQQMQLLAEALRKYTDHDALHLTIQKTTLGYDSDLWLWDYSTSMKFHDLRDRLKDYDDFFIFSELRPNDSTLKELLIKLGSYKKITRNNAMVRTTGELTRQYPGFGLFSRLQKGWICTGGLNDFDIAMKLGFVGPTRNICPVDKIPKPNPTKDKIRICFAPTKKSKGIPEYEKVTAKLTNEYDDIELIMILGKSWKEAIEIKSTCNITFDQLTQYIPTMTYANSAIESMWLKQPVVSRIDLWTQMLYPEIPIININNEEELYLELKNLLEQPETIKEVGKKGREFVEKYHHPKVVVEQWDKLMRFVKGEI